MSNSSTLCMYSNIRKYCARNMLKNVNLNFLIRQYTYVNAYICISYLIFPFINCICILYFLYTAYVYYIFPED
jgi:hypothetical protein